MTTVERPTKQKKGPFNKKSQSKKKEQNFNRKEKPQQTRPNLSPVKALKRLSQYIKGELINEEGSAPHLVLTDPRDESSRLSVVYFAKDAHFRVYDNYDAKVGDTQEVFHFDRPKGVSDFILSDLEDESGCFDAYTKQKSA